MGQRCDDRAKHAAFWVEAGHAHGGTNPCTTVPPSSSPVDIDACTEFGFTEFRAGGLQQLCIKPANAPSAAPFVARDVFMTVSDLRGSDRGFDMQALWFVPAHCGMLRCIRERIAQTHRRRVRTTVQARHQDDYVHWCWSDVN